MSSSSSRKGISSANVGGQMCMKLPLSSNTRVLDCGSTLSGMRYPPLYVAALTSARHESGRS
eukprot:9160505-Heterocapsa_arctica.AAC.1